MASTTEPTKPIFSHSISEVAQILNITEEAFKEDALDFSLMRGQTRTNFNAGWKKWASGKNMPMKIEDYLSSIGGLNTTGESSASQEEPASNTKLSLASSMDHAMEMFKKDIIAEYLAANPCTCRDTAGN